MEFQAVYQKKRSSAKGTLVMYVNGNGRTINRLGVSCSRKIGNSVVRHKITRKLREIFRLSQNLLKQGYDIVIVVRKDAAFATYREIEKDYLYLCSRHHMILESKREFIDI